MITTTYDPEADALYVYFLPKGTEVAETREVAVGIMHDLDEFGRLIGIEVVGAQKRAKGLYIL